ncbi:AIM24 family protein [Gluconacetobacter tumulisoli]|uniref:AIM24 family protein n=1 Tax=Gluconacetobacter tumulisoli TaxID=1286189 RepID=A0A7W4KAN8_9PROT|nr:AIM24 family protein [Gluconacetobacter tumulisoli]MBB2203370.1 AIM24 family protein [Gluconacetobacter tumulisoli]
MRSTIAGTTLPVLRVMLDDGERLIAETGELSWKTPNVDLATTTSGAGNAGFFGAMRRSLAGGGLFMTEFTARGGPGLVAFAAKIPGAIVEHAVGGGRSMLVHRHGFLCATPGVTLDLAFQRSLGAGIFGGDGFRLQKVSGQGMFWSMLGGEVIPHDLAPGEAVDVHPGLVGMFEDTVSFDITMLPGIRNKLFGGDGFFLARLTGPGRVWLQTLTAPGLAHALAPYLGMEGVTATAEGSLLGAAVSGLIRHVRK